MSYALIPNFAARAPASAERVPYFADRILQAIDAHDEGWSIVQAALPGEQRRAAEEVYGDALDLLLSTPCATRAGAFALLKHLRWWLEEEAGNAELIGLPYRLAEAREAELTLLLGCDGPQRIPVALPSGRLVSVAVDPTPPARPVIEAGPAPAPAFQRFGRAAASAGELLACLALIAGGTFAVGLATWL
ncbi:hypothetical protein LKMONMHP_4431 [Methylobacterium organophilum]|uniref:Transmembrane protein n=2 Tax=Methylobacterium organophilum TaxID=410 RepID=A0ABQ4TEU5_METOR|nr:hypothetical protein LKMONMHP_4431 [Methylobacterium organophilum]